MRITLGEIGVALGCGRDGSLWPGSEAAGLALAGDESPTAAPWTDTIPVGAHIDSRQVTPGSLFFCIKGAQVDGHHFALAAARAGAVAIIAERDPFAAQRAATAATADSQDRQDHIESSGSVALPPVFLVPDTVKALQRLAAIHRDTSTAKVVGITGTAGKTSVKEVMAHVLSMRGQTVRSPLNKNNSIGLPLSMLNAPASASFWVMEAGISQPQDMDELGAILRPDVAVVLNVGGGHAEGLGDKGVAHYKAKFLEYIASYGVGLYSMDYPDLEEEVHRRTALLEQSKVTLLPFSTVSDTAYCRAVYEGSIEEGLGRFRVFIEGMERNVLAPFRGEMGSENVAAIFAVATKLGLSFDEISRGLHTAELPEQRFSHCRKGKFILVDDSYNANPLSSRRMLDAVREMAQDADLPLILVMGEMGELGPGTGAAHSLLGRHMALVKPDVVFWKGGLGTAVHQGMRDNGYTGIFHEVPDVAAFEGLLTQASLTEGLVLFKGSRMNRLEDLVCCFSETCAEKKDD